MSKRFVGVIFVYLAVCVTWAQSVWENNHVSYPLTTGTVISCAKINSDFARGREIFDREYANSQYLERCGFIASNNEPFAQLFQTPPLTRNMTTEFYTSNLLIKGAQEIAQQYIKWQSKYRPDTQEIHSILDQASKCGVSDSIYCPKEETFCDAHERYRSLDGTCNNLNNPRRGAALTAFSRLLDATYDDNVYEVRKSILGGDLITPRAIVDNVLAAPSITPVSKEFVPNIAFFIFAQLIAHDVAGQLTTHHYLGTNNPIRCCTADYQDALPKSMSHYGCLPFAIPWDDSSFGIRNIGCHNYLRSQPIFPSGCKLSPAQQANRASSYIDLSIIYGQALEDAVHLRTYSDGLLETSPSNILPLRREQTKAIYLAGDHRVNQTPHLAVMHSVLVRLHNQIVRILANMNPHWDDERLFQETRRINIAIMQHISFEEFVPALLGEKLHCTGNVCDYNSTIDATTMNDFSTGVYRYFHAFTPKDFELFDEAGEINGLLRVSTTIEDSRILESRYMDVARGLIYQPINLFGFDDEMRNNLFNGTDLISVDIQRGRDHGLAPYWRYREICGFPPVETFDDLYPLIPVEGIEYLKTVYSSPRDIDLLVGGSLEQKDGRVLGPTFTCISKIQFSRFKFGDRFFYTHSSNPHPFTEPQMDEIRKFTLAKLLCTTTSLAAVPVNALYTPSGSNPLISCSELIGFDLRPWRE